MNDIIIRSLIEFVIGYLVLFLLLYFFYYKKNKKNKKNLVEISYLTSRFSLKLTKEDISKMIIPIVMINTFIIIFTWVFIDLLPINFFWQLLVGFVLVVALIYAIYEIYGRHLQTKLERRKK